MSAKANVSEGNRWTYIRLFQLFNGINSCYGINICGRFKGRSIYFFIFLFFQITFLGTLFIYFMYYTDYHVLNEITWKWNAFVANGAGYAKYSSLRINESFGKFNSSDIPNKTDINKYPILRMNEALGKFNYVPERGETLYVWKKDGAVPVKDTNALFAAKERYLVTEDSCTEFVNRTKYDTTLTADPGFIGCKALRREMDEINAYVFKEELNMPIAFSILVYTDYEMIELLLRTIYKPHNTYCIHIDTKSPQPFRDRVVELAKCFDNVLIAKQLVSVHWGQFSILEAEMSCMKDLLNKTQSWKYFINLTGQEFPLRTNYEIAKVLGALRGFNNMRCNKNFEHYRLRGSGPPPYGLEVYKSSTHVILTRQFVEYLLNDEKARGVLMWSRKLLIPDEMVWPILNCNRKLNAPGSYEAHPSFYDHNKNFISRFKLWNTGPSQCHGKIVRGLCIFGPRDLDNLQTRHELFANKFHINEFPEVPYCLRNILLKRSILEYKGYMDFNTSFYKNIPYKW